MIIEASEILGKVELSSVVRETVNKIITIENPLNHAVEFKKENLACDNENITFNPSSFTIAPKSVNIN